MSPTGLVDSNIWRGSVSGYLKAAFEDWEQLCLAGLVRLYYRITQLSLTRSMGTMRPILRWAS
jgi:hypothetical protein